MATNALVIGASAGIGQEVVRQLLRSTQFDKVHSVSRYTLDATAPQHITHQCDSSDAEDVARLVRTLQTWGEFTLVVSCIGVLHEKNKLFPEKRLEDISAQQLQHYFQVNTIAPGNWLAHMLPLVKHTRPATVVFFSARVGSISDNRLGGWYGYRASKAALNMLVKSAQVEMRRRAKQVQLVCYHPGTVDTQLSAPFQDNVNPQKLFTAAYTVSQLLRHIGQLDIDCAPHYIDWQGKRISW